jgi:predicted aspartyl protease
VLFSFRHAIFSLLLLASINLHAATLIPFNYRDGEIWVKIAVAGKSEPLNFLVDSGAGASVLDLAVARRLGVKLGEPMTVQGADGRAVAYHVNGFCARAANVPIASSFLATDLSGPSRCCHQRIDGLLGVDFFLDHIVQIDYATETIRLLQRDEVNSSGSEVLPLKRLNDAFCVRASIAGTAPELLRVDTGCCSALEWVVTGDTAKKHGSTTIGLNSGSMQDFHTDVQLGTTRITTVKTGIHTSQMFSGESGLIGNGLLSRFTITIDAAKRRCLFSSR